MLDFQGSIPGTALGTFKPFTTKILLFFFSDFPRDLTPKNNHGQYGTRNLFYKKKTICRFYKAAASATAGGGGSCVGTVLATDVEVHTAQSTCHGEALQANETL